MFVNESTSVLEGEITWDLVGCRERDFVLSSEYVTVPVIRASDTVIETVRVVDMVISSERVTVDERDIDSVKDNVTVRDNEADLVIQQEGANTLGHVGSGGRATRATSNGSKNPADMGYWLMNEH